jgi:uncharacterized membrane protein
MRAERTTFSSDFRRFFGRGLAVLLPSILTLWLLWYACVFVFNNVAVPINKGIRWIVVATAPLVVPSDVQHQPRWYRVTPEETAEFVRVQGKDLRDPSPERTIRMVRVKKFEGFWEDNWYLSATGLVVAITLIYLAGLLLGGLLGRRLYHRLEALISRIPGFKQVYPHVKQLVDLVIGDRPMAFKRVVIVQYPRQGIWSIGLVTSNSLRAVADQAMGPCVAVFIPSTPTPFTGFCITVPESEVIDLPISIDEAIRFVLTGGVLVPERQAVGPQDPAAAELAKALGQGTDKPAA